MCWCGRTKSLSDFRFSIADFRLGAKRMNRRSWVRWLNSFSDNRKSKTCAELSRSIQNLKWLALGAMLLALSFSVHARKFLSRQVDKSHPRRATRRSLRPLDPAHRNLFGKTYSRQSERHGAKHAGRGLGDRG